MSLCLSLSCFHVVVGAGMQVGINTKTGVFMLAEGTQGQTYTCRAVMMVQPHDLLPALVP